MLIGAVLKRDFQQVNDKQICSDGLRPAIESRNKKEFTDGHSPPLQISDLVLYWQSADDSDWRRSNGKLTKPLPKQCGTRHFRACFFYLRASADSFCLSIVRTGQLLRRKLAPRVTLRGGYPQDGIAAAGQGARCLVGQPRSGDREKR
jgi:hypothetical protein